MSEKLIFPIGFDLEEGVKEASKEWKNTYQKQLQKAIDDKPLKAKIELETKGLDLGKLKEFNKISKEMVAASKANAKMQRDNIAIQERQRLADERVAAAHERTLASVARRKKAEEGLNRVYKTQSSYLQRLAQRMIAYASVTQVFSFIRNIREVTAQFELQRVALGSIIGDLNEANAMFEQIKVAAVKSPFQIKELVTYTKQLAAYKIETDELFETTQRLADISAGLGVGMERLVLAYGQIRATGYLRASEVRQLTEAGIPIVEELAKKMSQLRGETVSAAEVMGLISERAISFGMVKGVFDDMTSAGGMFYKMQEKQAETLAGQWSNLQDSISIMYEEIGNTDSVNNAMKSMIGLIKSLAENWRTVGNVASWSVGAALGYAKVIKPLSELIQKHRLLNKAKQSEIYIENNLARIRALNAQKANYIAEGLAVEDDGYLQWIDEQIKYHQDLADKHTKIASEARKSATALKGFGGALKSIGLFIKANWVGMLITAVTALVSWLISARQEANRLNKELAKIGTEGALQADQSVRNFERLALAIRESADGSAKQTEALEEMKRAYGEFLPSQDKSIINLVREKDGYNAVTQAIREKIALQIQEQKLNTIASEYGSRITKKETKLKDWLTGEDWRSVDKFSQEEATRITNAIRQAVSDGLISAGKDWKENAHTINRIIREQTGLWGSVDVMHGIERQKYEEFIDILYDMNDQVQQVEWSMESATGSLGKYTQAYKDFKEELKDVTGTGEKFSFEWNESKTKAEIKAYNEFIGDLLAKEGIKFDIGEAIDFKGLYEALGDNYPQLKQVVAKIQGEYEKLVPKDLEKLIKEQFSTLATKYGASLDKLQHYFKSADQSTQDWVKTLKDAKTELGNQIFDAKKLDKDTTALEAQQQVIEAMITAWDNSEKTQKAGAKAAEQALKDELAAVEKIYKRYQDLRKLKSETDTQSILANEFKGVSLTTLSKAYSPKQMIEVYQKALAEAQRLGKKDLVLEIQTKLGEFNVAEEQRKLEKSLKDLSDKISRTKTAKEFFDRMLGMTGDRELSATLTLSVYGGDAGQDFGEAIAKQMAEEAQAVFGDIDISQAIDKATGRLDPVVLQGLIADLPEDRAKKAQDFVDKLVKSESDYISNLYKSYEEFLTFEQQKTRVVEREEAERQRIRNSVLSPEQQKALTDASYERQNRELGDIAIKEFKASEDWLNTFESLENLATPVIENIMVKLKKFIELNKEAFTPEQIKTLMSEYQKLYDEAIKRNPFKAIADGMREWQTARAKLNSAKTNLSIAQTNKSNLEYAVQFAKQRYEEATIAANKYGGSLEEVELAQQDLNDAQTKLDEATQKLASATTEHTDALNEEQRAIAKTINGYEAMASAISNISSIVSSLTEVFGVAEDSELNYFLEDLVKWLGIASTVLSTIAATIAVIDTLGAPLLLIVAGIAAVAAGISYFVGKPAREAEKEIERLNDKLDDLSYAFERLEKAQEDAFGTEYIQNYRKQLAILYAEAEAYEKQAQAERSKGKKEDEEKTKEYEKSRQEVLDEIADMQTTLSEKFLASDLASTARDFAQAWIEAYKEFSNTTDAMKGKFQDMIENMIVESVLATQIKKALEPVFSLIDNMGEGDFYDKGFWANVVSAMNTATDASVEGAEILMKMLEQYGVNVRSLGGNMTGISRDIATASEESILGLAAGINTQNFYISQVPTKLDTIIGLLRGGSAVVDSGVNVQDLITIQNQFLSHLPTIAQNTAETVARCERVAVACESMASKLNSAIKPIGTPHTHSVNVTMSS